MKTFRTILIIGLSLFFVINITSFFVVYEQKDSGKHKGWYKNPNNPHHPNSTNPGKAKRQASQIRNKKNQIFHKLKMVNVT